MPKTGNFGIEFWDKPPYNETWTQEGADHKRTVLVKWPDAALFPTAMMGDAQKGGGGLIKRMLPAAHPVHSNVYCVGCNLTNGHAAWINDQARDLISFKDLVNNLPGMAEFEVIYRNLPYDVLPDGGPELGRFVARSSHFALEVYQMPGDSYVWAKGEAPQEPKDNAEAAPPPALENRDLAIIAALVAAGFTNAAAQRAAGSFQGRQVKKPLNIPEGIPIQRPIIELKYTWYWVPEPLNEALWRKTIGKVNAKPFDGLDGTAAYDRLTVLATAYEKSDRFFTPAGHPVRNITYTLSLRPDSGWNQFYRKSSNQFEEVRERTTGDLVYKQADLLDLFLN